MVVLQRLMTVVPEGVPPPEPLPGTPTKEDTVKFTDYFVAKQADRRWAVAWINALGHSRIESMHTTRRAAQARASFLNQAERLLAKEANHA